MISIHSTARSSVDRALMTLMAFAIATLMSSNANAQSGTRTQPPVRSQASQSGSGSKPAGSSVKQSGSNTKPAGSGMKAGMAAVGLDGYCPVCIIKIKKWVKGSSQFAAEYDGKQYLFPNAETKQTFLQTPAKYTPIMGGDCIVAVVEMGKRIPGSVQYAALHKENLYLFANERAKNMFRNNKEKYVGADVAFGGKCSVCLVEMNKQVVGVPEFTTMHKGMRYLFPSNEQQQMFESNPSKYEDRK